MKHHADDESAAALTMASCVVAAVIVLPLAVPGFAMPAQDVWPLMALIGFLGATGFVLLTIGLRTTPASVFAIVDYMNILWAALFGFVFFSRDPGAALLDRRRADHRRLRARRVVGYAASRDAGRA